MIDLKDIKVISQEECEAAADYVVCMPLGPSPFEDNVIGICCKCGRQIMHRPHVPSAPKICQPCLLKAIERDGMPVMTTTERCIQDAYHALEIKEDK